MSKDKKKEEKEKQTTAEAVEETKQPADEIAAEENAADDGADTKQADNQNVQQPDATAQAEAAAAEMKSRYVRLQADFANFKKRTATEKQQISEVVKMDVLQNILPVIDNFERALQVPQDSLSDELKSFVDGYTMIYKQLMTVLEKEGVTKIDAVGKPFDPNYHQAVMRVPSDEYDNDVVVEVLQEGYLLGDKTLRPAMVKVAFNG
ncbi:nucleotide exchange factor GrpE [uncultured Megasphaera sp.]|uniref:nucleotide exchange factor GrpE n=1 Tax=uncultured Megasphaera sp. TaxID=165188 RepID=UPI0025E8036D|nr:nucleotide exchange factor GrpE [uncultured Megasphaera sp.]